MKPYSNSVCLPVTLKHSLKTAITKILSSPMIFLNMV